MPLSDGPVKRLSTSKREMVKAGERSTNSAAIALASASRPRRASAAAMTLCDTD